MNIPLPSKLNCGLQKPEICLQISGGSLPNYEYLLHKDTADPHCVLVYRQTKSTRCVAALHQYHHQAPSQCNNHQYDHIRVLYIYELHGT